MRRVKEITSGRRKVGRPPGPTEDVRSLNKRIRDIKRFLSKNNPELIGLQLTKRVCGVLDNEKTPLYAAMRRKEITSWTTAVNSKKQKSAIIRRIARA
jgi:hypothetical protein